MNLFVTVAQSGSFAAAARKLDLDPSSVSRTIASLEEQMGLRLFQRTTRQLVLTEAGEIYLARIAPLLDELEHALDEARKVSTGPGGTLRMTSTVSFGQICLLPLLPEFKANYPDIKLELILNDAVLDLIAEGIDLACRLTKETHTELISTRLLNTRFHVCISPEYYKTMPAIQTPHDLENHNCLVFNLPQYRSRWIFKDKQNVIQIVPIKSNLSITSALALRECALAGMGPVLLADWLIKKDIAEGRLFTVLNDYEVSAENFDTGAWLLYPSRQYLPNKTRVMIDFLKEKFQQ